MPKGILIELHDGISPETTRKIQALKQHLLATEKLSDISEIITAYNSLYLIIDSDRVVSISQIIEEELSQFHNKPTEYEPRTLIVPVWYDPEVCPDLQVAAIKLGISTDELIKKHTQREYYVAMLGFLPGFIYLGNLDEDLRIERKAIPNPKVEAGSVAIAGDQTGIYSLSSPGGWYVIGKTLCNFFDIDKNPPTDLNAGDTVRFKAIGAAEFEKLKNGVQYG
jgi:inhibitor of KinA